MRQSLLDEPTEARPGDSREATPTTASPPPPPPSPPLGPLTPPPSLLGGAATLGRSWCAGDLLHGRYRLERSLGRGGMGEVLLAEDLFLRQKVAIKTLRGLQGARPEQVDGLRREVALAHAVIHPGLARTFDLGQGEGGVWYLTMEYLEGESLAARLQREGPLPIAEVRRIGLEVALAVEAAHRDGVIHRDLKPANVQLTPQRGAVILDFGLAQALPASGAGWVGAGGGAPGPVAGSGGESGAAAASGEGGAGRQGSLTGQPPRPRLSGSSGGTPRYMSPEQWLNEPQGPAVDVFSLGIILYEMLTGRPPHADITDREELKRARLEGGPPPLHALRKDTPRDLERLVMACLHRDPARRPASMLAVARGLVRTPVRHHLISAALACGMAALVIAAAVAVWQVTRELILLEMKPAVERLAMLAAARVDGAELAQIHTRQDMAGERYRKLLLTLRSVRAMDPSVRYVYAWRKRPAPRAWECVVDTDPWDRDLDHDGKISPNEAGSVPGETYDDRHLPGLRAVFAGLRHGAEDDLYRDQWGVFLSGYAQVQAPDGEFYIIGVDVGHGPLDQLRNLLLWVFPALAIIAGGVVLLLRRRAALLDALGTKAARS